MIDTDGCPLAVGRCWLFGDNIDTDALAPGQFIKLPIETLAAHCLESINPQFAENVAAGDVIVAGRNFGMGSSREQAAQALLVLGVGGVVAQSFGGIFFRNAINLGLPVFTPAEGVLTEGIAGQQDQLTLNIGQALLDNHSSGNQTRLQPLPDFLVAMLKAGGLVKVLERRFNITNEQDNHTP